jgi:hypothetical protein
MRGLLFLAIILTFAHACYHYNVVNSVEASLNSPTTKEQTQKGLSALATAVNFIKNQVTTNLVQNPATTSCLSPDVQDTVLDLFNRNQNVEALNLTGISLKSVSEDDSNSLYKLCSANVLATDNTNYRISYKVVPMQDSRYEVYIYLN